MASEMCFIIIAGRKRTSVRHKRTSVRHKRTSGGQDVRHKRTSGGHKRTYSNVLFRDHERTYVGQITRAVHRSSVVYLE